MKINIKVLFSALLSLSLLCFTSCEDDIVAPPEEVINPITITIEEFNTFLDDGITAQYEGQWVRIENVQFTGLDVGQPFLGNRNIQDETGATAVIRTNSDRDFAYQLTPEGSGAIQGYVSKFVSSGGTTTIQLILRNLEAVEEMSDERFEILGTSVTIQEINDNLDTYLNQLVTLENVQFIGSDTSQVFNGTSSNANGSKDLEDCEGNTIVVFTSSSSALSNEPIPDGSGRITATVSTFGETIQLLLDEVPQLEGPRCGDSTLPPCEEDNGSYKNICFLRNLYAGGTTTVPSGTTIRGTVISDRAGGNFNSQNIAIQDGSAGIVVRFDADHSYDVGDDLEIDLGGKTLGDFNGLVQVSDVTTGDVTDQGNVTPTVTQITCEELNSGLYESQLVIIQGVTYEDAGENFYGGSGSGSNRDITDASGTSIVRVDNDASFGGTAIPSGSVNVRGVVGIFGSDLQLLPRNASDVSNPSLP